MRTFALLALAACTSSDSGPADIVGPFTGNVARFAVDRFTLPASHTNTIALGDDLDGDGQVDNEIGYVLGTLYDFGDASTHAQDMIESGAIASFVEVQAPDVMTAKRAGAWYLGHDGADSGVMGGAITDGTFTSNRTRTTHVPGRADLRLAVFADADPSIIPADKMELDLTPDGHGGYDAVVRGAVRHTDVLALACSGIQQMISTNPDDHYFLADQLDGGHDGQLTCDRIWAHELIGPLLAPDLTIDGEMWLSIGVGAHLIPCDSGACAQGTPADACHDRVKDGSETGIDCGGACGACPVAQPTCSDGVRDGLETDVDCGWNCGGCGVGQRCWSDRDCLSGACRPGGSALGTCA